MSDKDSYRLGDHAAVEPLVNRFAAWAHVVSPAVSGLHLKNYQLEVLRSYLKEPGVHYNACRNPKLRSGPLLDIEPERMGEVADFLAQTERELAPNLALADALIGFHNRLVDEATGMCLDSYYALLPPELRGYVELVYDYYHRPTVRLFEGMLYKSPYFREDLQSFRLFCQKSDDGRPFFNSTPRLHANDEVEWHVPFSSPQVDELFALDTRPRPLGFIRELLGLTEADDELLLPLLARGGVRPAAWDGEGVRVRYFGHACLLIEFGGVSILTDPYVGVMPLAGGCDRFTYSDLPPHIDFVLVTHAHQDHFCLETLLRLRHRVGCVVVPRASGVFYGDVSLKLMCEHLGFSRVVELDALETIPLPGGAVIGVPFLGEHVDLPHSKSAYLIRAGDEQMLVAADSDCLDPQLYANLRQAVGDIRTVFIGTECVGAPLSWSSGSLMPAKIERHIDQSRRAKGCDSVRAHRLLDAVGAERLYVYALGREPWFEYLLGLAYTEESKQLIEARRLVREADEMGYDCPKVLFQKDEIHLAPVVTRVFPVSSGEPSSEDQFCFE